MTSSFSPMMISIKGPGSGDSDLRAAPAKPGYREPEANDRNQQARARRVHLFSGLSRDETSRLTARARCLSKARGEFIYMHGDCADAIYILRKGRVKLSVLSQSGKEIAIDIIEPGEIFGEFALVDESPRSNMTQALDDATMWVFNKQDFEQLLAQPKLAMNYIRLVGDRRRRMEKKLSDITSKEVPARVCELLRELCVNSSEAEGEAGGYLVPHTHNDVASLIGASRQTTTSVLNKLERQGIIELGRGSIRVKFPKALRAYTNLILICGLQIFFGIVSAG